MTNFQPPDGANRPSFELGKSTKARLLPGHVLEDRFEVKELIADGGLSTVYRGRDAASERVTAVKLLHPSLVADYEEIVRLKKEARLLSQIDCSYIAKLYRFGLIDERFPFVVMEFLEGFSLKDVLDEQAEPLGTGVAIKVGMQVCNALEAAHEAGVLHADLKPSNIIIVEDEQGQSVKTTDFGLSRTLASSSEKLTEHLTRTGLLTTSVPYMSPELCLAKKPDVRSDVYSLGCVLFEIATGKRPFPAADPVATARQQVNARISSTSFAGTEVSPELQVILIKALEKEPFQRYQSISQMREDLAVLETNDDVGRIELPRRHKGIPPHVVRTGVIVAVILAALIIVFALTR